MAMVRRRCAVAHVRTRCLAKAGTTTLVQSGEAVCTGIGVRKISANFSRRIDRRAGGSSFADRVGERGALGRAVFGDVDAGRRRAVRSGASTVHVAARRGFKIQHWKI
jgi:hypothetical protein